MLEMMVANIFKKVRSDVDFFDSPSFFFFVRENSIQFTHSLYSSEARQRKIKECIRIHISLGCLILILGAMVYLEAVYLVF